MPCSVPGGAAPPEAALGWWLSPGSLQRTPTCCSVPAGALCSVTFHLFTANRTRLRALLGACFELLQLPRHKYPEITLQAVGGILSSFGLPSHKSGLWNNEAAAAVLQLCLDVYPSQNAHPPFVFDVGIFYMQKTFPVFTRSSCRGKVDVIPLE